MDQAAPQTNITTQTSTPSATPGAAYQASGGRGGRRKTLTGQAGFEQQAAGLSPDNAPTFAAQSAALEPARDAVPVTNDKGEPSAAAHAGVGATEPAGTAASPALEARLVTWRTDLVKATDPVAFMTTKSYTSAVVDGKNNELGFYTLAIGETQRLSGEFVTFASDAGLSDLDRAELERLVALAGAWKNLYTTLRDTGDRPTDRDGLAAEVLGVVEGVQGSVDAMSPDILGLPALGRIDKSLDEIRTFVGSWSLLAASDGGAAKPMWASFLQTTERYRMILCQYGALEERGGDARGTAKMAVKGDKGMAKDRAAADKAAEDSGGYMVLAMQTYSYQAANQAGLKKQIDALTERVAAGEFKTLESAQQAGRREIGSGMASESYYKIVDAYMSAAWNAKNAKTEKVKGDLSTFNAVAATAAASENLGKSDRALDRSKAAGVDNRTAADEGLKEEADLAWGRVQKHQKKAAEHQKKAEACLTGADKQLDKAAAHYTQSALSIETARTQLELVDAKRRPEFYAGAATIESGLGTVEQQLAVSQERLAEAKAMRDKVKTRAEAQRGKLDAYSPEQAEVEVAKGLEGAEIETFVRGSLSVSATIPGAPFIKINGSAETAGGVKQKQGEKWGYLENDWSLGMSIDLVLFSLSAAYVAGSSVEAKGKLSPGAVMEAGEAERSNYAAKREIYESGAAPRLMNAFAANDASLRGTFGQLKKSGELLRDKKLNRGAYRSRVMRGAFAAKKAQDDLWTGIMTAFIRVGDLWSALQQAGSVMDSEEVFDRTMELGEAAAETAPEDIEARGGVFMIANDEARAETKKPMDKIADYTNDPNVTFEDYGGWEFGAEVGGKGMQFSASYETVTVQSDGEGEQYDFEDTKRQTLTLAVELPSFEGEIAGIWKNGEFDALEMSATLRSDESLDDETRGTIQKKAAEFAKRFDGAMQTVSSPKMLVTELGRLFGQFGTAVSKSLKSVGDTKWNPGGIDATPQLMLGFDFEFGETGTNIYARIGSGMKAKREMDVGAFEIEAEMTTGQQARFHVYRGGAGGDTEAAPSKPAGKQAGAAKPT